MIWAILITIASVLFCCIVGTIPGIVAIVFAAQVNTKLAAGDEAGAWVASRRAKLWCWITTGLTILGSGISPANPAEMLSSPRLDQLLKDARKDFDFVIVDTPPLLAVTDPAQVAPHVDGVLLVVRLQKNRTAVVKRAREVLETQGVTPLGVVVTGVEPRATYGAYSYRAQKPVARSTEPQAVEASSGAGV